MYLARFLIVEIRPSKMSDEKLVLIVRGKNGARPKPIMLVLEKDLEVDLITTGKPGQPNPNKKKVSESPAPEPVPTLKCTCINHMGTRKQKYRSREQAVAAILRRHLHYGGHSVYPCPKEKGVFHVRSQKLRVDT